MKPNKEGIWEWFDDQGVKRLVDVANVEFDKSRPPYLRVCFWGGYYNVHDECVGTWEEEYNKAEWPDRWGSFVGIRGSVSEQELYSMPSSAEMEVLRRKEIYE
jgi:hypothetical protein